MTSRKLVIDTNVLISAALLRNSLPARLVRVALAKHALVFSQPTFDELRSRLNRPKFDRYISLESRQRVLHDFSACAHWVEIEIPHRYCRDQDDDKFIETALRGSAALLISGDKDLLEAVNPPGLQIVSPAQASKLLEVEKAL